MNFDVAIFYRDDTPEELISGLTHELREAGLNVETKKRPNEPVAAVELIPVVVIFLASQFVSGLLKEAAKDVYPILKEHAAKFLGIKQQVIVSSSAPNKLAPMGPVSSSFAIWSESLDGRSIKFQFLSDKDKTFIDKSTEEAVNILLNHAHEYPNDSISKQLEGIEKHQNVISLVFDESSNVWKVVDNTSALLT
jgi:hypothetical protein